MDHLKAVARLMCLQLVITSTNCQWEWFATSNNGPPPRKGHTLNTWINGATLLDTTNSSINTTSTTSSPTIDSSTEILVLFGGRSQSFYLCEWPDGWDNQTCGDHFFSSLVDTSIILSSLDASYPDCYQNCSNNGWCHYDETIDNSYCICFDDYRGEVCQYREVQTTEYDIWLFDVKTRTWTQYDFVNRGDYAYANAWPWPSARIKHTSVINPITNELIVYGGYSEKCVDYCNDLWYLNLTNINTPSNNAWTKIISPNSTAANNESHTAGERWHHKSWFSFDTKTNHSYMYIYGGHRHFEFLDDIMQFDLDTQTWRGVNKTQNNGNIPPTRMNSAFEVITDWSGSSHYEQNFGYIHGGYHAPNRLENTYTGLFSKNETFWLRDLWSFEIINASNYNPKVIYSNVSYNGLVAYEPIIDEILSELNRWYAIPYPRSNHKIFYVNNSDILLLFGGYISHQFMNDTWRFNLTSQKWIKHYPPKIWEVETSSYYIDHSLINITNLTKQGFTIDEILEFADKTDIATNITDIETLVSKSYEIYCVDSGVSRLRYIIAPRMDFDMTYVPSLNSLILFGGVGSDRTYFDYDLGYDTHHIFLNDTYIMRFGECLGPTLNDTYDPCNAGSDQGSCYLQYCFCESEFWGNACQNIMCPSSSCTYDPHTWLPTCTFCSGNGICHEDGTCECVDGYKGEGCESLDCLNDCTSYTRGNCTEIEWGDVQCVCHDGFTSDDCSDRTCPLDCSGRGTCDPDTGECECDDASEAGRHFKSKDYCARTYLDSA